MNELTESQLLLLDNFMYISGSSGVPNGTTVNEIIETMYTNDLSKDDLSGGITVEQAYEILNEIKSDSTLCNLTISASLDTDGVRAACFVDDSGNATVAFRGTGGTYEAWNDNFLGEYLTDTPCQERAADFFNNVCAKYDNITVTGHSKGGNLAQYCTVLFGDKIDRCVSYDGQGFNDGFLQKYANEIPNATEKITSICCEGDVVNTLLNSIAGDTRYLETMDGLVGFDKHKPWELYLKNKGLMDENGCYNATVPQSELVKAVDDAMDKFTKFLGDLPPGLEQATADSIAAFVGLIMAFLSEKITFKDFVEFVMDLTEGLLKLKELFSEEKAAGKTISGKKSADFTVEPGGMRNEIKEMEEMEALLGSFQNQVESMILKSVMLDLSLVKTITQISANVKKEKENLTQLRMLLEGCLKEYSNTETKVIILGSASPMVDFTQNIVKVYS